MVWYLRNKDKKLKYKGKHFNLEKVVLTPTENNSGIVLDNLTCIDANNQVFEHYDSILLQPDVNRTEEFYDDTQINKHKQYTKYQAISEISSKDQGLFLPSLALTCSIVVALYENKDKSPIIKTALDLFCDLGSGYVPLAQNTIVNLRKGKIIHYPKSTDFQKNEIYYGPDNEKQKIHNLRHRDVLSFNLSDSIKELLTDRIVNNTCHDAFFDYSLKNSDFRRFITNLTGLQDPKILVTIGGYFNDMSSRHALKKPAWPAYSTSDFLGCKNIFDAKSDRNTGYAALGVILLK